MTVAPTVMPTASARKMAVTETRKNRKLTMSGGEAVPDVVPQKAEAFEEHTERRRDRHHGDHTQHDRDEQEDEVALAHAALVEPAHASRVYQEVLQLEPDEECRGHPGPALVEEVEH